MPPSPHSCIAACLQASSALRDVYAAFRRALLSPPVRSYMLASLYDLLEVCMEAEGMIAAAGTGGEAEGSGVSTLENTAKVGHAFGRSRCTAAQRATVDGMHVVSCCQQGRRVQCMLAKDLWKHMHAVRFHMLSSWSCSCSAVNADVHSNLNP